MIFRFTLFSVFFSGMLMLVTNDNNSKRGARYQ